jgi:aldehyde dehydrogenase (NAD+)
MSCSPGLIPKYFEPEALSAVVGGRKVVTKFPDSPFDFIFATGSVGVGRVVMQAAAEHLTPVLLELRGQNPAIVNETANIPGCRQENCFGAQSHGEDSRALHRAVEI